MARRLPHKVIRQDFFGLCIKLGVDVFDGGVCPQDQEFLQATIFEEIIESDVAWFVQIGQRRVNRGLLDLHLGNGNPAYDNIKSGRKFRRAKGRGAFNNNVFSFLRREGAVAFNGDFVFCARKVEIDATVIGFDLANASLNANDIDALNRFPERGIGFNAHALDKRVHGIGRLILCLYRL